MADAITEIFNLFKRCNKYIDETMPWVLAKDEAKKDRLETVLWNLIQGISAGARLLESFMPSHQQRRFSEQLGDGHVTEKPEILFQRLDLEEVMKKVEELHPPVAESGSRRRGRSGALISRQSRRSHLSSSAQCSSR